MTAIDLSKQQALDTDLKTVKQINLTSNQDRAGNTTTFFIIEEAKDIILDFSQETETTGNLFCFNIILI